jgi:hypothetical protein
MTTQDLPSLSLALPSPCVRKAPDHHSVAETVSERSQGKSGAYIQPAQFDNWGTPQDFFDKLDREFRFDLDVCAEKWNRKCEVYFGPDSADGRDGLDELWGQNRVCWCNPPYGAASITRWIELRLG